MFNPITELHGTSAYTVVATVLCSLGTPWQGETAKPFTTYGRLAEMLKLFKPVAANMIRHDMSRDSLPVQVFEDVDFVIVCC